jgi:hypothetical protein
MPQFELPPPYRTFGEYMQVNAQLDRQYLGAGIAGLRRDREEPAAVMPPPYPLQRTRKEGTTTWHQTKDHIWIYLEGKPTKCARCGLCADTEPWNTPCDEEKVKQMRLQRLNEKEAYEILFNDSAVLATDRGLVKDMADRVKFLERALSLQEQEANRWEAAHKQLEYVNSVQERLLQSMGVKSDGTVTNGCPRTESVVVE